MYNTCIGFQIGQPTSRNAVGIRAVEIRHGSDAEFPQGGRALQAGRVSLEPPIATGWL